MRLREVMVSAVVVLAACSSSSPNSSSATSTTNGAAPSTTASVASTTTSIVPTKNTYTGKGNFNSCDVVTQADAADAIGESVTPRGEGTATSKGGLACVFYGPAAPAPGDPNQEQPDSVRAAVFEGPDAAPDYNDFKPADGGQPISGLGDQAYFDGAWLSVLKGEFYLRVSVIPAGGSPSLSDEQKLAAAILPKLQGGLSP